MSEYIKAIRHKLKDGEYITISQWTAAESVEYTNSENDGLTLENIDWVGTKEEYDTALVSGEILDGMHIHITDDAPQGLAAVASTGNYDDLINQPFVPTKASDINADEAGAATSALASAKGYTDSSISSLALGNASKKNATTSITDSVDVPTSAAVKAYVDAAVAGASNYLGTITSASALSTSAKKGDFYRVSAAWSGVHVGDIIIAEKNNPSASIDNTNWTLMHNEENTDTTYTFVGGTNEFTVTPSGGTAQKVTIVPSIGEATTEKPGLLSTADKTTISSLKSVATGGKYTDLSDVWSGTKAEYNTAKSAGSIKDGDYVNITDDYVQDSFAAVATSGSYIDLNDKPTSLPASDVYAWAKAANKPSYNASEVGAVAKSDITISNVDIGEGASLASGKLYFVYE